MIEGVYKIKPKCGRLEKSLQLVADKLISSNSVVYFECENEVDFVRTELMGILDKFDDSTVFDRLQKDLRIIYVKKEDLRGLLKEIKELSTPESMFVFNGFGELEDLRLIKNESYVFCTEKRK